MNKKKILAIFVLALIVTSFVFALPRLAKVNSILCENQFGECDDDLMLDAVGSSKSYLQTKRDLTVYLDSKIQVESYSIHYQFPDTFKINTIESTPTFALKNSEQGVIALISKDGTVLSFSESTNLPALVTDLGLPSVGEQVLPKTKFALDFLFNVYTQEKIVRAELFEDKLEIRLENGIKVIAPLSGDKEVLVGTLLLIKSQLNSINQESRIGEGKEILEIDLRFKNPVLR